MFPPTTNSTDQSVTEWPIIHSIVKSQLSTSVLQFSHPDRARSVTLLSTEHWAYGKGLVKYMRKKPTNQVVHFTLHSSSYDLRLWWMTNSPTAFFSPDPVSPSLTSHRHDCGFASDINLVDSFHPVRPQPHHIHIPVSSPPWTNDNNHLPVDHKSQSLSVNRPPRDISVRGSAEISWAHRRASIYGVPN